MRHPLRPRSTRRAKRDIVEVESRVEALYVIRGEYIIFVEGKEIACPAGSFIFIPAGVVHGFRVGRVVSRKLNLYTPSAMVGYFDKLSLALKTGDVDDASLSAIATAHSMDVLEPAADGYRAGSLPRRRRSPSATARPSRTQ